MSSKSLRVVAHLKARADKIDETRDALVSMIEPTRAEDGCIVYEMLQNDADPTDFTFVEEWSGHDELSAHLQSQHVQAVIARAEELFAAPPDIRRYTLVA
jgi:quinol monooxygenase YgiN